MAESGGILVTGHDPDSHAHRGHNPDLLRGDPIVSTSSDAAAQGSAGDARSVWPRSKGPPSSAAVLLDRIVVRSLALRLLPAV